MKSRGAEPQCPRPREGHRLRGVVEEVEQLNPTLHRDPALGPPEHSAWEVKEAVEPDHTAFSQGCPEPPRPTPRCGMPIQQCPKLGEDGKPQTNNSNKSLLGVQTHTAAGMSWMAHGLLQPTASKHQLITPLMLAAPQF